MSSGSSFLLDMASLIRCEITQRQINMLELELLKSGLTSTEIVYWLSQDLEPYLALKLSAQPDLIDDRYSASGLKGNKQNQPASSHLTQLTQTQTQTSEPQLTLPQIAQPQAGNIKFMHSPLSQKSQVPSLPHSQLRLHSQANALMTQDKDKGKHDSHSEMKLNLQSIKTPKSVRFLYCIPSSGKHIVMQKSTKPPAINSAQANLVRVTK